MGMTNGFLPILISTTRWSPRTVGSSSEWTWNLDKWCKLEKPRGNRYRQVSPHSSSGFAEKGTNDIYLNGSDQSVSMMCNRLVSITHLRICGRFVQAITQRRKASKLSEIECILSTSQWSCQQVVKFRLNPDFFHDDEDGHV